MNTQSRSCLLVLPLLAMPVVTQTAAAPAPHVLVDTVGPDSWRVRLGPTNLGSMLESEQGRGLWEPHVMPMLDLWRSTLGDDAAYRITRECLLGYGGRIRVGIWMDPDSDRRGPRQVAIALEGDGRTDLTLLAKEVRRLQERLDGEWSEVDLGPAKVEVRTNGSDAMSAPLVEGNHLLIAIASKDGLGGALAAARSFATTATGKPPAPNTPALRVEVDLPALLALAKAAETENDWKVPAALGVESLGKTTLTVGTAGPQVQLELVQAFVNEERGLFAGLFPATEGVSALQRLHPASGSWKVGRLDLKALYAAVEKAVLASRVSVATTQEELRADIKQELGVDLVDDLLAHTTDEVLLFVTPPDDPEQLSKTPWTFAVRLADQAAFQKGLATALDHAKPMLSREATIEHGDGELRRYGNMLGYDLWFAVGQGMFLLAGGSDCEDRLKALLDSAKNLPATSPEAGDGEFGALRRFLPPGLNGLAHGDLDSVVGIPIEWWRMGLAELLPWRSPSPGDDDPEQQERMRALLKQHRLDTARTATGYCERQWRWRFFW